MITQLFRKLGKKASPVVLLAVMVVLSSFRYTGIHSLTLQAFMDSNPVTQSQLLSSVNPVTVNTPETESGFGAKRLLSYAIEAESIEMEPDPSLGPKSQPAAKPEQVREPQPVPATKPKPTAPKPEQLPKPTPQPEPEPPAPPKQPADGLTQNEREMLNLLNEERKSRGLEPLQVHLELTKIAKLKSKDLVELNYFSHQSPTYGSPFEMMKDFGISYLYAAENLAGADNVSLAHNNLMNSPGHKANILNPNYTHIGIGIIASDKYGQIYTQMFIGL